MASLIERLEAQAIQSVHGTEIPFNATKLGNPIQFGYQKGFGIGFPGTKHYRRTIGPDNAMHIKIFGDNGSIHREHVNPDDDLVGHLVKDMKFSHWMAVVLAALGIGAAFALLSKR